MKTEIKSFIQPNKRVVGTFELYNVKSTKNEQTFYDVHILITHNPVDYPETISDVQKWHDRYRGQPNYAVKVVAYGQSRLMHETASTIGKQMNKFDQIGQINPNRLLSKEKNSSGVTSAIQKKRSPFNDPSNQTYISMKNLKPALTGYAVIYEFYNLTSQDTNVARKFQAKENFLQAVYQGQFVSGNLEGFGRIMDNQGNVQ